MRRLALIISMLAVFACGTSAWASLYSGSLSTPILFDSSVYKGEPPPLYADRTPVANPPGGLSSTAAWAQYGMKLNWNVTNNGNGTYTYNYHFWPGWEPATNGPVGGASGTGNPYVTNKEVLAFDVQLGSAMTMANISNATWNTYEYNGARIGSGTANTWINYNAATGVIISQSSDYDPAEYDTYNFTNLKVANLKGQTGYGETSENHYLQSLFRGLQWFMPKDPDTGNPLWKTDVNFDLTFTSTYAPGWGNFFANSGQTGSNNNFTDVVAFDGTFDATGTKIAKWSNSLAVAGGTAPAPVPIPPSVLLFGSGLSGLFFFRRKKIEC